MNVLSIVLIVIGGLFLGVVCGILGAFFYKKISKVGERKELDKFFKGEKPNKYKMDDGKIMEVNKFVVPAEKNKNELITLKGGIKKENAPKNIKAEEPREKRSSNYSIFKKQ